MKNEGYSLYPYFSLDEEKREMSVVINLRKVDGGLTLLDWDRINNFNLKRIPKIDNLLNKNDNDIKFFKEYVQFFENFVKNINTNEE